jgi:hypothetical protein
MRETRFALALGIVAVMAAPARAQDPVAISGVRLGFDALRFQTGTGGSAKTLTVKSDGTYTLDAGSKHQSGTLTPNQYYEVTVGAAKADFTGQGSKKLGTDGTPFTLAATTKGATLSVSGAEGTGSLESFQNIVRSLSDFTYEKTRWFPGFSLFKPKLPGALELTLDKGGKTNLHLVVYDNGMVKIDQDGRTLEANLTEDESAALARAVRDVDDSRALGDVSWNTQPDDTKFKIVTYETFREYLLAGSVGNYGSHPEVGGVMVALDTMLDRVAREQAASSSNIFTDMLGDLGKTFDAMRSSGATTTAAPARTPGMDGALIDARTKDAKDRTQGDDAAER